VNEQDRKSNQPNPKNSPSKDSPSTSEVSSENSRASTTKIAPFNDVQEQPTSSNTNIEGSSSSINDSTQTDSQPD
jgi:hypothetical protein